MIELVDYNTVYGKDTAAPVKKATRRRGGSGTAKAATPAPAASAEVTPADDAVVVDETPVAVAPVAETAVEEAPVAETLGNSCCRRNCC